MYTFKHFLFTCGWVVLLLWAPINTVNSQVSVAGVPLSFSLKAKQAAILPAKTLRKIDTASLTKEDRERKILNRYAVVEPLNVDIRKSGIKTEIYGKGTIWRYEIKSPECFSTGIFFETYELPEGATLYIYNNSHSHILGGFTSLNNTPQKQLTIAELKGNHAIIEYFEPYNAAFEGKLIIGSVSQAYKDIFTVLAAAARVGINCPEGANWQDHKHAVCRMIYTEGSSKYYCTGFLVNNVREDGTPYFMTANHCISTADAAASLVVYFNFENSTCTASDASTSQSLSGSKLTATNNTSDFTLLLLNEVPPKEYLAYLAGWDASGRNPQSGVCVHHPNGTPKSISIDNNAPTNYAGRIVWDNNFVSEPNTHWLTIFDTGDTESGSSGSPLFDENKRVIGQLHGGSSTDSYYGKINVSWNSSAIANTQLRAWLDPDNSGQTSINGMYLRAKPRAAFSAANARACLNDAILLKDETVNAPNKWKWKISPTSYKFLNGTGETSKNPLIEFNNTGNYSIALVAQNDYGIDSIMKDNFISVVDKIEVAFARIPADSVICGCDLIKFPIAANGAAGYSFAVERTDKINISTKNDTMYLSLQDEEKKYGSFNTGIKVQGALGSCLATDSAVLKISMPVNDNIAYAIRLWPGNNGTFTNFCASAEPGEPLPPFTSCTGVNGWCPTVSDKEINNSVWFTFIGPSNGKITIDTRNINNRIAVYEAKSFTDITSGNRALYKILSANDNRSATETSALIENLEVTPGKIYWLQVDGNNSATGNISISLLGNSLELFPNPTFGEFEIIISSIAGGLADVKIYSATGKLLLSETKQVSGTENRFGYNLSSFPAGIYIIRVKTDGIVTERKVMVLK